MTKAVAKKKVAPKPKTAAAALDDEYVVEKLLGKRGKGGVVEYKVKWQGFPSTEATWEPASALSCDEIVAAFEQQQVAKKVDKKTPATRQKKMCEDCGLKQPGHGLASDGKRRWCAGCGKAHGAVSLQKAPAASLKKPPKKITPLRSEMKKTGKRGKGKCLRCKEHEAHFGLPTEARHTELDVWLWYVANKTDRVKVWCGECTARGKATKQLVGCRSEDLERIHNHSHHNKKKKLQVCDSKARKTKRGREDKCPEDAGRITKQAVAAQQSFLTVPIANLRDSFKCIDLETHTHAKSSDYLIEATAGRTLVFKAILGKDFASEIVKHFVPAIKAAFDAKSMLYGTIIDLHNLITQDHAARSQESSWSWTNSSLDDILRKDDGNEYVYDTRTGESARVASLSFCVKMKAVWEGLGKKSRAVYSVGARQQTREPNISLSRVMVVGDYQMSFHNKKALFKLLTEANHFVTSLGLGGFSAYENRPTGSTVGEVGDPQSEEILQGARTWLLAPRKDNK